MVYLLVFNKKVVQVEKVMFPVNPSLTWVESDEGAVGDSYIDGILIPYVEEEEEELDYKELRQKAYAESFSVGDQLDILVDQMEHMLENLEVTAAPSAQAWIDTIKAIKLLYPKP